MAASGRRGAAEWVLRDIGPEDLDALVALNDSAVPAVNRIGRGDLERILALACYGRLLADAEGIVAFTICLADDADYWSANFHWFRERYDAFLYLDRVVVAERARGLGAGTLLYDDMHRFAATAWPLVALEVNLRPPNPGSDRFHRRLGYTPVGVRAYDEDGDAVTMYVRPVRS